ncbi:hypothetical protein MBLNU457_7444t2 [Dothideomycetes sp. NU457]
MPLSLRQNGGSNYNNAYEAHPIWTLHKEAVQKFESKIRAQSKTFADAVTEYVRRYRRPPPPNFDGWFDSAIFRGSVIIDEFDIVNESMEPFWRIAPEVIRDLVQQASGATGLYNIRIRNGTVETADDDWLGLEIARLLGSFSESLPDLDICHNGLDEPRVILPEDPSTKEVTWSDGSKQSAWNKTSKPCTYRPPSHSKISSIEKQHLPFITNQRSAVDICQNPSLQNSHGFFIAPTTLLTTEQPVPVLSAAAPSTFSDILYPSPWYDNFFISDLDEHDLEWSEKADKLYWAGSTTGGWNRDVSPSDASVFSKSHRHRFVEMTNNLDPHRVYRFLKVTKNRMWTWIKTADLQTELYDTKFTSAVQCDEAECERLEHLYKIGAFDDKHTAYKHKLLMDLDGNSFSGRFYNFLASRSCPLKQTVFREWHDERLKPWVHYVPISTGMEELPEVVRYLTLTEEGQEIARTIAQNGRLAHRHMLRKEDKGLYLYRLFLEYARVTSAEREDSKS